MLLQFDAKMIFPPDGPDGLCTEDYSWNNLNNPVWNWENHHNKKIHISLKFSY